jgi:hypothetical protein
MTPNELGQLCYEAHQREARKLYASWHFIPWQNLSTAQHKVWEEAGYATWNAGYAQGDKDGFKEGHETGFAAGLDTHHNEYE